jgi:methylthioribose-1-phosphate isomerase
MSDEPVEPVPIDPHRRRFFRLFAGDVASSVGSVLGAARALQAESASAAQELLGMGSPRVEPAPAAIAPRAQGPYFASSAGYRAPFRFEDDAVFVWDQRQLPDILQELELAGAADAVNAITEGSVIGSAVQAQVAAAVLALVAARAWDSRPFARRATIRGSANALRMNRPASAQVALALDRMLAVLEDFPLEADGRVLADAMRREAEEIIVESTEDHGKISEFAVAALPGHPLAPLHVLTAGSTGAMGSGVFGTALGVITSRHHAGQPIHALVAETRPWMAGARIACWEIAQAGVPHALVADAAAPGCIAAGEVEAVLVTADRIAANGDMAATVGTYPLALAAREAGVPVIVCVATTAIDLAVPDLGDLTTEDARASLVMSVRGQRIAPEGVHVRNPVTDLVPAELVSAYVTEEGVLRAPYGASLARAVATASERRLAARGFRALQAQRQQSAPGSAAESLAPEAAEATESTEATEAAAAMAERQAAIREMASGLLEPAPATHEEAPAAADEDATAQALTATPTPGDGDVDGAASGPGASG